MQKIKISAVSYLNAAPFIYGLRNSEIRDEIDLSLDIPAVCAQKTIDKLVDIGLVPVAVIPKLEEAHILGDYCIGASGKVGSVMLYSEAPLQDIGSVLLDYQSRTSVMLAKILAKKHWKISPEWKKAGPGFENDIQGSTAAVVIGDRTFALEGKYKYSWDLAEEWKLLTGLPFVFACWVANTLLPGTFIEKFNRAIAEGIRQRPILIKELEKRGDYNTNVENYLNNSISYAFDEDKKKALQLFLSYMDEASA
jgi:chorismate dehydratase